MAPITDIAKSQFLLNETSGTENVADYQNVTWPVNKKAYKHKSYTKQLKDQRGFLEHEMLFKLQTVSVVREFQIGFINYWASESELVIEPVSVLV